MNTENMSSHQIDNLVPVFDTSAANLAAGPGSASNCDHITGSDTFVATAPRTFPSLSEPHATSEQGVDETQVPADPATKYEPFPIDAIPDPVRSFLRTAAAALNCDSALVAMPLLTALARCVGNSMRIELKSTWSEPVVLWTMVVAESGSMKSPAFALAMKPFERRNAKLMRQAELDLEAYNQQMVVYEAAAKKHASSKNAASEPPPEKPVLPARQRIYVVDTTIEALAPLLAENPRGLMASSDELASWLGSHDRYSKNTSSNETYYLSMWTAAGFLKDRRTDMETIYVPSSFLCVTGGIPPASLKACLRQDRMESGLGPRFLMVMPPRQPKVWTDAVIPAAQTQQIEDLIDTLFAVPLVLDPETGEPKPVMARFNPAAMEEWKAFYNAHNRELQTQKGIYASAYAKLEAYTARFALLFHMIRWATGQTDDRCLIEPESLRDAIQLIAWFKREVHRVYGMLCPAADNRVQKLIDKVGSLGGRATVRQIQQNCRWLKESSDDAECALQELVTMGLGCWESASTSSAKGGRVFVLKMPDSTPPRPSSAEAVDTVDGRRVDGGAVSGLRYDPNHPLADFNFF